MPSVTSINKVPLRILIQFNSKSLTTMNWKRGPVISRGSTATVSLATTATGEFIAVKSTNHSQAVFLEKEEFLLSQLNSPYIVNYIGFDITYEYSKPMYNLFLEYVSSGSLSDLIKKHGGSIGENLIKLYTHQILLGLDYLHSKNLVHCDIKSQNILVGQEFAKIADFGCAKLIKEDVGTSTFSGTPMFMSPEVARGESQGFKADVWALGCTIIEMATGCSPWHEAEDPITVLYKIGYSEEKPEIPQWLSENAKDFLSKCLKREIEDRWSVKQLVNHPFCQDMGCNFDELEKYDSVKKSPTGVLDSSCIWESLDIAPENLAQINCFSPAERMRGLVKGGLELGPNLPNWVQEEEEQNWLTLRSIDQ